MSSYVCSLHHIIFSTKHRTPALTQSHKREFLGYCCGIIKGMNGRVFRINCMEDHIHLLVNLPPTLSIATFVKRFKISSGNWLRAHAAFPQFGRWQEKYAAFSVSWDDRHRLIEYIRNQEEHHRKATYGEEIAKMVAGAGLQWDQRDEGQ